MYNNKKISLAVMSCKRLHFLKRVIKAFSVFCLDTEIIDDIIFFDDSSSDGDKREMEELLNTYFPNTNKIITHFYENSFPDNLRHARVLNTWREKLIETDSDYCFLLEDDYLFVDLFKISEAIDALSLNSSYAYFGYSQSFKKFPEHIKPVQYENYWEWYYDPNLPLNCNLFYDDVSALQVAQVPDLWLTYINWPSFSLRPGVHHVKKLLSIGEFSTTFNPNETKVELEFAQRWAVKYKSLCHKRFHIINLGFEPSTSAYTINNSD
jgi:hypothetical protein